MILTEAVLYDYFTFQFPMTFFTQSKPPFGGGVGHMPCRGCGMVIIVYFLFQSQPFIGIKGEKSEGNDHG